MFFVACDEVCEYVDFQSMVAVVSFLDIDHCTDLVVFGPCCAIGF